ncbi:MAG: cadherin-like beta sandwich domain-containing protein [Boseongicola sp.]|nr:cadherin-like beta sandwich domain-containing protein [Boseongicola sp.]
MQRRRRAFSGVLSVAAVLALLASLFATGAEAQTVATLVSNTGQQQNAGASRVVEAQSFTTGPHGTGYTLSSVRLRPFLDFTGDTGTFVTIKSDSAGRPGTLVAALETPDVAYVPGNFFAYTAPAGTVLQADTTYWIVLNEEQAETDWQAWGKTASSGEDSASLPGWSIGNSRLQRSGTSWTTAPSDPVQFDIRGHRNADPTLSIADASAIEGNAVRFAVSLDNATDGAVTVQYDTGDDTASAGTDYTAVSSGTLTIPAGDTVAAISIDTTGDSADENDETFTVTLSSPSSNADLGTDASATGTILDDDGKPVVGVTGGAAVEGSDVSFAVSIRAATDADVTVEYSTSIGSGDTASASDFTAATGETATITAGQTETVISIPTTQDSLDESDETFTLAISNPSSNAELGAAASATGTIEDDDTAGLVLSTPSLEVTEGASNSYTLALATRPSANVSVSIAAGGSAGLTLGTSQLTFTPSNWDQAQTVSVSAVHDNDAAPGTARLTHTAGGGGYGAVTAELPVNVTDDDTPAILLSRTTLPVSENGSATYTVALATLPTEKVTLELAGTANTDLTVTPDTIEFEPDAWNTPVTVTVEAAADLDAANDPETLTYTASGGDYEGSTASVAVEVTDSVSAAIVLDTTRLHVKEGGSNGSYTVALNLQPASDVTVEVTVRNSAPLWIGSTHLSGASVTLTFTPDDWDEPQNVIVAARNNGVTENREFRLRHRAAGGGYDPAAPVNLPVLVEEKTAQNGYVFSAPALSVAEGGTASYTLKLGKRPSRTVNVTVAGAGNGLTVEPESLAFTPDNWNDAQTVTVTAASQVSAQEAAKTLTHTGDGAGYGSGALAPGELPVTIVRDVPGIESGGVTLTSSPLHAADTYASGETVAVAVTFDRDVDVNTGGGSPGLAVDIGSSARTFGYAGMSGNRTLTFEYVVQAGDLDSDGISIGTDALALNGATIRASTGQRDADLGGTALAAQVGHRVDGGQTLAAAKLASLGITHGTASLALTPQFDADTTAYDVTTSGSDEFVTVSASAAEGGDATILPADADTDSAGHQVRLNGTETEITVTAVRAPRPNGTYTLKVTQPRPSVSGVTVTSQPLHATDTYASSETIAVAVKFDRDVDVNTDGGSPGLDVDIGSSATSFGYAGKSGSGTLTFEYEVQAGDLDSDGISVGTDALALNGATIRASIGQRDADLGATTLATQGGHRVDGGQTLAAAKLASLGITHGTASLDLTPQFDADTTAYDATTLGTDEFVTVSASAAEGGDATILPADADGNADGHQVRLDGAETEITVTAVRPPRADRTYTLQVTHAKPTVSIAASVSTLAFHLQGIEFTVTRAAATAEALDVNFAFTQDQDFLPAGTLSRTVTIPANQTSATLSLASSDFSGGATSDGTLTATISADSAYAVGTDASASVAMVAANPAIVVRPGSTDHVFREDSGTQTISIVAETAAGVPEPTDATFRILARTRNGTAVGGLDYGRIPASFVSFQASDFAAQDGRYVASKSLDVTITDDALAEDSEDFSLQLIPYGFPDAVSLAKADGTLCSSTCDWEIVIVDDDSPPAQVTGVVLTPGGGKLDVAWDEVTGADGYKVQWRSGTETFATAASDNREAAVSSGSTTTHTIPGIADGTDYTVRVIATRDGLEGTPSTEATERPDLRTLTIADATATEGDALAFTVTLSPAASADVTVGYAAADGTATSDSGHADGADYTAPVAGAQLTIPAGQTTGTISVATGDDSNHEGDETLTVTLAGPSSNAVLGTPKTATGTIENDDVTAAEVSSIAFTSLPSDGEYDLGDTIEVSVTFDAAVDVTGTPRVALLLDGTPAADSHALHDPGASSATVLVFRKTVTAADDDDTDGIGVAANALELNGGSIVNQGTTEAAVLDHAAVPNGANIKTRWIESIAVTSTPTVPATVTGDPVYGPGETVRFTVKFESAVTVDTGSGVPALKFSASDSGRQDAAYESGSGGTDLVFAWTVPADVSGDEGAIGVPGNVDAAGTLLTNGGLVLNGGTIEDAGNRAVNVRHGSHTTGSLVDTTAPALAAGAGGAVVDGNELVLAFERASGVPDHLDEDSEPAPGDFTVTVHGTARAATGVDVDGASVTVTLASAVGHAQHVTVGYAPGTDRLQDRWGNGVAAFTGRVARNDTAEPALSIAGATAAEDDGKIEFAVTLDAASGEAVTVDYATSDGSAKAGTDYAAASGTLEFAAGETSETVEVTLADDALAEGDETFKVTLSNVSDASIAISEATGTIEDDEGTPTLTIADATATEGDALAFTVTLSPAASTDVTVGYAAADGTATSDSGHADGADYTAPVAGAQLTIPAGQTTGTISVATGDDSNHEGDETLTVTLAGPSSNAVLGTPKTATGTIENDDAASADADLKALSVSVGGTQVSLTPAFAAGTLEYEADVENTAASVTVSATENHRGASVSIAGDDDTSTPNTADLALAFGESTVKVTVTAQDGVTEKEYLVKVTRAAPVLEWAHDGINVGEDEGDVEIAVSLTPALSERVSVDYATEDSGDSSTPGEDYTSTSGTLVFEPGETRKTFTLSILDDTVYEPTNVGNVVINLSNATAPATFGRNGTVLLVIVGPDNDSPATATMEDVSVDEDEGAMTFVMNLDHPVDGEVAYIATSARVGGTATESDDYGRFVSFGRASISIPAGQTSASLEVTIVDDDIDEEDETLEIGWRVSTGGLLVATEAVNVTGTIVDDDTRGVTVSETALPVAEGGTATYTVVLDSQPTGDVTVTPSRSSGDADVTVSGALTFTPSDWDTAQTVTVSAAEDADAEVDAATVSHAVSGADYGSVAAADVAVTVSDNDTASTEIRLSLSQDALAEGAGSTTITVTGTLDGAALTADVPVTVSVGAGTDGAVEGTDYGTVADVALTIDASEITGTATFALAPVDDGLDEDGESLTVGGTTTVGGLSVTGTALTIEDDDTRGVTVSETALPVPEGGTATYTVVLDSQPTGDVTVTPSRSSGDADVTVSGALTFTPSDWDTAQTVTVSAAEDADAEVDAATVSHAVSGADYGSVAAADVAVTVSDNDTASDVPGRVTGLTAEATVSKVVLNWTAPSGTVFGYRIEASYDGGSSWAEVMANTYGTGTAYTHVSGLKAGETRHYRVSAIFGDGAGPVSEAVEANATIALDGLTAAGLAVEDTADGEPTVDLCWKPTDVVVSDLGSFAIQKRRVHPSFADEWADEDFYGLSASDAADCEAGSIGLRTSYRIDANVRYAFRMRARHARGWALSNDAEAVSVDTTLDFRAEVKTGNSDMSADTDVPATVCRDYDDPSTPGNDAGTFIVNVGFTTGHPLFLYYETVNGFAPADDVTLVNATAELVDRPYSWALGYRLRITPIDWGQPVAVSVPADAVTHAETGLGNQASNVFQRNTADETDCDEGSTTTLYQPFVRRVEILDDDDRNGRWTEGERVSVAADFSENVFVTTEDGVPYVSVTVDDETVQAPYASGSGSSTLVFAHTVTDAQSPVRSMALLADSMTLNDGTITGANGPSVMLRHPGKTREGRALPAAPRLTAEWEKYPPGHSGDGRKFVVRVLFSEPVNIKVRTLRDHALTVVDGDIDTLWQVKDDEGNKRNDLWAIRLMPTSSRDLELALAATTDCDAEGAICTADKRPLSSAISLTVPGPAHEITVADAEVDEGPGAALEFVVTLSEAAPYRVKVDYETEDVTATAGLDYTAVSGQLTFERGETAKTVTVPVLDDDHDDDGETLTLKLSNPTRATIADGVAVGTIRNRDMMPSAWLARFGRTVAEQVLDSVEERISATPRAGVEVKLAGQGVGAAASAGPGGDGEEEAKRRLDAQSSWLRGETEAPDAVRPGSQEDDRDVTALDLLTGSSFRFAAAGDGTGGGLVSFWGRGASSSFDGREGDLALSGEVTSALFGADWTRGPEFRPGGGDVSLFRAGSSTTGLMLSHARGEGTYRGASAGKVESTVTGLYPYGRLAITDRVTAWSVIGYGAGSLALTPDPGPDAEPGDSRTLRTDLDLMMAAAGLRGVLLQASPAGGPELAVKTDALAVRTRTDALLSDAGILAGATGDATRLRLGLQGTWHGLELGDGTLEPAMEFGVRLDGGDAETGFGLDAGAGFDWTRPESGLRLQLSGRGLLTHESKGFRVRGVAGSLVWQPRPEHGRGPKLRVTHALGEASSGGMDTLLSQRNLAGLAADDSGDPLESRSFKLHYGYGFPAFGGRFTSTPEIDIGVSDGEREYGLGWRLDLVKGGASELGFALKAARSEAVDGNAGAASKHTTGFHIQARW